MDNRNNLTYEQMFMDDYNKFIYPELSSEKYGDLQEPGSTVVGVAGDVAKEAGGMIAESAKEFGQYLKETPLSESIPTTLNELSKGIVSGAIGIGGDTEQLVRGIYQVLTRPDGQSKLEAFFKGLEQDPMLPTSSDVEKKIEKVTGQSPKGTGFVEGTGNVFAPATAITKGAKLINKIIQSNSLKSLDSNSNVINVLKTNIKDRVTGEKSTYNTYITNKTISNEQGVPLTLYHGTNKKFDNFDIDKSNTNVIYFTNDKSVAKQYSGKSGEIKSANVKMNKPLILSNAYFTSGIGEDIKLIFNKIKNKLNDSSDRTSPSHIWNPDSETINKLKSKGYDGIIVPAEINSRKEEYYMVFDPSQIEIIKN